MIAFGGWLLPQQAPMDFAPQGTPSVAGSLRRFEPFRAKEQVIKMLNQSMHSQTKLKDRPQKSLRAPAGGHDQGNVYCNR